MRMKNTMLWSVVAMVVVTVAAAYIGFVVGKNAIYLPPSHGDDIIAVEPENSLPQHSNSENPKYLLGEQEGRLAVYTIGKETPDLVFDVYIKYLPQMDQEALKEGIVIQDYGELTKRIEDYIS